MSERDIIRILLVDDSALIRSILHQVFEQEPGVMVVGEASNGKKGCEFNRELRPDVIIMDINMPVMDGVTATRQIMAEGPVPIIIFSSSLDAKISFEAVSAGAVDIIPKPDIDQIGSREFIDGLKAKMVLAMKSRRSAPAGPASASSDTPDPGSRFPPLGAVVIGASTGGPLAVRQVLKGLPGDFPVGIAVVQHLEESFDQGYADWLNEISPLSVRLAEDGDSLKPGSVLIAPVGRQLAVRQGCLKLEDTPAVLNQKPAVDVLFSTAADYYRGSLLGILLTGMGRDGADGCRAIRGRGGYTVVQDESTSAIFGMPRAAIEEGGASEVVPLPDIANRILAFLGEVQS